MAQPQMRVACQCGHVFTTDRSNTPCPSCKTKGKTIAWPTSEQLEAMGLVRCEHEAGCSIYVDPANMPAKRCIRHGREQRRNRSQQRRQPRVPYLPRGRGPGRDVAPTRRDRMAARDGGSR